MRAESWKAIRIPEPARAWRSWHASIMPDSSTAATVFPSAARAASRTFSYLFSPTRFHEEPKLFRCWFPVLDERDGGGSGVQNRIDQETAVAGDVVLSAKTSVRATSVNPRQKQHHRCGRRKRGTRNCNRNGHHLSLRCEVVQFLAVGPPQRVDSARRGYLPLPTGRAIFGG